MNRNPTATLWLLAYSGITAATHVSIVNELRQWPNLRHSVLPGESLIDRARSRVASTFLLSSSEMAGDVLLFVDADISWQTGDLSLIARRALEHNAIVGGVYAKRTFGEGSALRWDARGMWQIGTDDLIPITYAGNGFVAIPRTIVRAVADTLPLLREGFWPMFLSAIVEAEDAENGKYHEWLSEDYAFCHRARELGFKVYASTGPRLVHEGSYSYRLVDARVRPPKDDDTKIQLDSSAPALAGERR